MTPLREAACLTALLCFSLILNLLSADRSPTVWQDEVQYADPAINLRLGNGFTSTAWEFQPGDRFWAGNVPLYPLLLSLWLRLVDFHPSGVRALNHVLIVVTALLLWTAVRRARWIESPALRLLLVLLTLSGFGITFSYRCGRPDGLTILLSVGVLASLTIASFSLRSAALCVLGCLIPLSGMQLLPFTFVLGIIALALVGRPALAVLALLLAGIATGLLALFLLYQHHGLWPDFVLAIVSRSNADSIRDHPAEFLADWLRRLPGVYASDPSAVLLLLAAILLVLEARNRPQPVSKLLTFGLAAGLALPATLSAAGIYPVYYQWMGYLPLALGVCSGLDRSEGHGYWRQVVLLCVTGAALLGLPARLSWLTTQWSARDYAPVRALVDRHVTDADRVLCDYPAYYAVKPRAGSTILPRHLGVLTLEERDRLTVLIVAPADSPWYRELLRGSWHDTGDGLDPPSHPWQSFSADPYRLRVYRRLLTPDP